jgi:hypothetical protein
MSVAVPVVDSWDGLNRRIYLKQGVTSFHWIEDIYKEYRNWRRTDESSRVWLPFMYASGNEPKGGGKYTPRYVTLLDGVKVVPYDENIRIEVTGEAITDDADVDPELFDTSTRTEAIKLYITPPSSELVRAEAEIAAVARMEYNERVIVDTILGRSGTEDRTGTAAYPSNNLTDAITIAQSYDFDTLAFHSDYTFAPSTNVSGFNIIGQGLQTTDFYFETGSRLNGCRISLATCSGTVRNTIGYSYCLIDNLFLTCDASHQIIVRNSLFRNIFTTLSGVTGEIDIIDCQGLPSALSPPTLDMNNNSADIQFRNYSGFTKITNCTQPVDFRFFVNAGGIELDSSVTAGNFNLAGTGTFDDNSTNVTSLQVEGLMNKANVADAVSDKVSNLQQLIESHSVVPAYGDIYFYDPVNGNDSYDGLTKSTPVLTFSKAQELITEGNRDLIFLINSTSGNITIDDQWVINKAHFGLRASSFGDVILKPTTTSGATISLQAEGFDLHGIKIMTSPIDGGGGDQYGIDVISGTNDHHFKRVKIARCVEGGIIFRDNDGCLIDDCIIEHFDGKVGLDFYGTSHECIIQDCNIYDADIGIRFNENSTQNWIKGRNLLHDLDVGVRIEDATVFHLYIDRATLFENITTDISDVGGEGIQYTYQNDLNDTASAVWEEATSGHTVSGTYGKAVNDINLETDGLAQAGEYDARLASLASDVTDIHNKLPAGNIASAGEYDADMTIIKDNVERALGLVQENYYIDNTSYVTYNGIKLMTAGRMRIYSDSVSVGTGNNVIATYNITTDWTNDEMNSYKVTKA